LEYADLPDIMVGPNKSILCMLVAFMGFCASCLGVLLFDNLRKRKLV